jgi:hypothetical protein
MGCLASSYSAAKYYYFVGLALTAVLTWILRDFATSALGHVGPLRECLTTPYGTFQASCTGRDHQYQILKPQSTVVLTG